MIRNKFILFYYESAWVQIIPQGWKVFIQTAIHKSTFPPCKCSFGVLICEETTDALLVNMPMWIIFDFAILSVLFLESHSYLTGAHTDKLITTIQWRHIERDSISNHQPHDCLLNRLFRRRSRKTSKLRVTGLCAGNAPVAGEFPACRASYAEKVSIWWRHHA